MKKRLNAVAGDPGLSGRRHRSAAFADGLDHARSGAALAQFHGIRSVICSIAGMFFGQAPLTFSQRFDVEFPLGVIVRPSRTDSAFGRPEQGPGVIDRA